MFDNMTMTDWAKINLLRDMAVLGFKAARQLALHANTEDVPIAVLEALNDLDAKFNRYNLDESEERYQEF